MPKEPPPPTQTFVVYFDLGRATLSPQGRRVADHHQLIVPPSQAQHAFPGGKGKIEVALDYQGEAPVLIVQDNGVGIDPAQQNKRSGLGLVRRLVEQISASIEVRRTQEGTRCEIVLPLAKTA